MCDTQVIHQHGNTYFAKNSDRESSEAQIIIRRPGITGESSKQLKTTYLTIPQVANRHGVILSKPFWSWGAEMGVNDQGVVIGNEAVFTKLVEINKKGLLGMDLVRLGLERGGSAVASLQVITKLLETHGQGGVAGFRNRSFCYDNSFIIADANEAWVLETAGKNWVAKKVEKFSAISNRLTIGSDYDLCSDGVEYFALKHGYFNGKGSFNFAQAFDSHFMPFMAKSKNRQALSMRCLDALNTKGSISFASLADNLRTHYQSSESFASSDNRDICMHGGGLTRPSQTCGSMLCIINSHTYSQPQPEIMVTATSAPCLSLYKPISFNFEQHHYLTHDEENIQNSLWHQFEWAHRRALKDQGFKKELKHSRDQLEAKLMSTYTGSLTMPEADQLAKEWHEQWNKIAKQNPPTYSWFKGYDHYWKRLNRRDGIFSKDNEYSTGN